MNSIHRFFCLSVVLSLVSQNAGGEEQLPPASDNSVSYYRDVRPFFQAKCHGCHQAAKASGEYVMTSFEDLVKGGESESVAIVPGEPDQSHLLELITPTDGAAAMPKKGDPLTDRQVDLVRRWILAGAPNDTPSDAGHIYDRANPPVYTRPPVITSLDYSPDGQWLAISGFHEVLLHHTGDAGLHARLIGLSERIESVRFSPDGQRLAVTGGRPGRMGEVQVWEILTGELLMSVPVTHDTVYGASWSPDGKRIAFGCADSSLRAIDSETGKQILYMAAHNNWVHGTAFSGDGQSVFSASLDKTVKKTNVATERFLGNVTTHTPGVLQGGMNAIKRHPHRSELLVGGADGAPKLFRMDVKAAPSSGGNPNQIREFPGLPGRVIDVAFSPDGVRAFACSSLNGSGEVQAFNTDSGEQQWQLAVADCGLYALATSPDGQTLAAGGFDGWVRLVDVETGNVRDKFLPVEITEDLTDKSQVALADTHASNSQDFEEQLPGDGNWVRLEAEPQNIELTNPIDYAQLIVRAHDPEGVIEDLTRLVEWNVEGDVGRVTSTGRFIPSNSGQGTVVANVAGLSVKIPVAVRFDSEPYVPDFIRDVSPVLSKAGCNAGTCHGANDGKNGFKLSLRGYDPLVDVRAFTDDLASRRVNLASPSKSLMLLKSTAAVAHEGGQAIVPDSIDYRILRDWIADGARLHSESPAVNRVEVYPKNPVLDRIGAMQQMRVVATYSDGSRRDVTHESFVESGNTDIAESVQGQPGLVRGLRRGEAPLLVRYEGAYASSIVTIMGSREGFIWQQPPANNSVDELVHAKLKRTKTLASPICNDFEFVRRIYLDLLGLPPSPVQIRDFIDDPRDSRWKRDELIDRLIGSPDYVEHWTNKWADLLQVNGKYLGRDGAGAFRQWIRKHIENNTPYDDFCHQILTASGSNRENPAASYFKILRTPQATMENTTHLFLATRFNCNKCHDHPFERWTQDQYYEMAAFFAQVGLKEDPASEDKKIRGTNVVSSTPYYEIVFDKEDGEIEHDRTGAVIAPAFPYEIDGIGQDGPSRRQRLALWITSPENPYFANSYVNRIWGYLTGVGLIEPLDDIRAGNPPTNPELLEWLTQEFVGSGFDTHHLIRTICQSRTYQLSIESNPWNEDDEINFSHAQPRRLPAEVLYDAVHRVMGAISQFPGVEAGTRAAALPDVGIKLPDGFLGNLGRPPRESACECERSAELRLGPVMALVSGPSINNAISDEDNVLAQLVDQLPDDRELCRELFLRILNRPATDVEIDETWKLSEQMKSDHAQLLAQLAEYRRELPSILAEREIRRKQRNEKLQVDLTNYREQLAVSLGQLEVQRQQKLVDGERELKTHELQFSKRYDQWEARQLRPTEWTTVDPQYLHGTSLHTLEKQDDLSIVVSGRSGQTTYTVVGELAAEAITAVRIEALTDERFPNNGPGRSKVNGNFVLTELRVGWAPLGTDPHTGSWKNIKITGATADFSQKDFDVSLAIDGNLDTLGGWAVEPETGKNHLAVFETDETSFEDERGLLRFELIQNFKGEEHDIGHFRVSVTNSPRPVSVPLPDDLSEIVNLPDEEQTKEQKDRLVAFFRENDTLFKQISRKIYDAKQPLPTDPRLVKLNDKLALSQQPLGKDPKLERLEHYVRISEQQLKNHRLTVAQDLSWALINNPAFLFNR